jgi:hypothetical protein
MLQGTNLSKSTAGEKTEVYIPRSHNYNPYVDTMTCRYDDLLVTKKRKRGKGARGRKASRKPKGTLRGPTKRHRPTQNTAEAEKAVLEQTPTETDKSSNHTQQNPEQTSP